MEVLELNLSVWRFPGKPKGKTKGRPQRWGLGPLRICVVFPCWLQMEPPNSRHTKRKDQGKPPKDGACGNFGFQRGHPKRRGGGGGFLRFGAPESRKMVTDMEALTQQLSSLELRLNRTEQSTGHLAELMAGGA